MLLFAAAWRLGAPDAVPWWCLLLGGTASLALGLGLRRPQRPGAWVTPVLGWLLLLGPWVSLGALAVDLRTAQVRAPALKEEIGPVAVTGWVLEVEAGASRPRMLLQVIDLEGVTAPPRLVRISPPLGTAVPPGRAVRCLAVLSPPGAPMGPGAYDPARALFFEGIGAVGYSYGACRPIAAPAPPWPLRLRLWWAAVRRDLAEQVAAAAPGPGGAVSAAVLAGDRSLMSPALNDAFQNSGLAHLLSVSGLHMGLAAGLAFAALHTGLAWIPGLALRWPLKKLAAGAGLLAGALYLAATGASVPAQRAFIMTAAAMGAVLLDRPAFTMRSLAAAAVGVTLLAPESVLEAGFQMSFAATAALVAWFEARRPPPPLPSPGWIVTALDRLWSGVRGALFVSLVAGLAVDPIAAYHFQRFSLYGLPANLATSPIVSLIVAPAALAGVLATPLGWDGPLQLAAGGLHLVAGVAQAFGARPEAVQWLPAAPPLVLSLLLLAMLWAAIWRGWLRALAVLPMAAALVLAVAAPQPIAVIDPEGAAVLARTPQGWALWRASRGGRFAAERLAQRVGLDPTRLPAIAPLPCDAQGCRWTTPGGRAARLAFSGAADMCRGDLLLAPGWTVVPAGCDRTLVIAGTALARQGGAAVLETTTGLRARFALAGRPPAWRRAGIRLQSG